MLVCLPVLSQMWFLGPSSSSLPWMRGESPFVIPHPHLISPLQPISKWGLVCHHPQPDTLQILINRCPKLLLANQIFTFSRGFTPDTFSKVRHTKLSLTLREKGCTDRGKIGEMCVREMCVLYWCVNIVQRSRSHKRSSIGCLVITLKWYKSVNRSL